MAARCVASVALVSPPELEDPISAEAGVRERRAFTRFDPLDLPDPLIARVKYGDSVTLLDVSAGGALVETSTALRPDATLVLEMSGAGTADIISVVSRVLRCHVSDVRGGIRYRGACVFKRPLDHPVFLAPPQPSSSNGAPDAFGRLEVALKTIVEGYRRRAQASKTARTTHDVSPLLESLARLHDAAAQRIDPIDRQVAEMLAGVLPALQRNESADDVMREVLVQLAGHVPALSIRVGSGLRLVDAGDAERITLNVWSEHASRATLTAEYPAGSDIDATQFRLLKAGAYLMGLADSWVPRAAPEVAMPQTDERLTEANKEPAVELPAGWHRVVVRFIDGKLLRGYSNNFFPDAAHLHLSPELNCSDDERLFVPIALLKALFFVRDLEGNADHIDSNIFDHAPRARKVEVTFHDGEVMTGSTLNYKPGGQGFFLVPANSRGNNQRVFVVLAAVRHLRFV